MALKFNSLDSVYFLVWSLDNRRDLWEKKIYFSFTKKSIVKWRNSIDCILNSFINNK